MPNKRVSAGDEGRRPASRYTAPPIDLGAQRDDPGAHRLNVRAQRFGLGAQRQYLLALAHHGLLLPFAKGALSGRPVYCHAVLAFFVT
jgi:hypothetical protein